MKVTAGLFDHMVLQRDARRRCDVRIAGETARPGRVTVTVRRGRNPVPGYAARPIGNAARGRFSARLSGLPAGGPYEITLSILDRSGRELDTLAVHDVLVGDVWLCGGQSNMQGYGLLKEAAKPHPAVRALYMDERWAVARDPIHNLWNAVDAVHGGNPTAKGNDTFGTGPAPAFGQTLHRQLGVPQGLIACAHGGTSMSQWDPALKDKGGASLYGAMLRRFRTHGARVAGLIWYQGESDAVSSAEKDYSARMQKFVRALRRDTRRKDLPVVIVQIGRVTAWDDKAAWNSVQEQQRRLPEHVRRLLTVPAVDLELDDPIHIGGADQQRLGRRMAEAMRALLGHKPRATAPIAFRGLDVQSTPQGLSEITLDFANVRGRLKAAGRPAGFCLTRPETSPLDVYRTELSGSRVRLQVAILPDQLGDYAVQYGLGGNPYCNITDADNRPLPVMGPLTLPVTMAATPLLNALFASPLLPAAEPFEAWACPERRSLTWIYRTFAGSFCSVREDIVAAGPESRRIYFSTDLECDAAGPLTLRLGYDGPVKVWWDRREAFADANGTNPALPDKAVVHLDATAGRHELVIGLDSHAGQAWGIFLRFERPGTKRALLAKGPDAWNLPRCVPFVGAETVSHDTPG